MAELEHVPTLEELAQQGLAVVAARDGAGNPTHYRPTPEGERLLQETMRRNVALMREHDELSPHRRVLGRGDG